MSDSTGVRIARAGMLAVAPTMAACAIALLACLMASTAHAGSTWVVNNTGDPGSGTAANCALANANSCTLRDAITAAASGDTIHFGLADNATIVLISATTLAPTVDLTIDGTGVANLTIDGNHAVRPFTLAGITVTLANLRLVNGAANGGGIFAGGGGGIRADNNTTLTVQHCVVSGGTAGYGGGGIYVEGPTTISDSIITGNSSSETGGGINVQGSGPLTIDSSTVSDNHSSEGGGIYDQGGLHLTNSTVSGNSASDAGGGVHVSDVFAVISNDTFYGNSAVAGGAIFHAFGVSYANVTIADSTFAANTASPGYGADLDYLLYGTWNLVNDIFTGGCRRAGSDPAAILDATGSFDAGTSCQFPAANSNAFLDLGPLGDHGGPTFTILPGIASAAIDGGSCAVGTTVDQRGIARPQGGGCDAGAVESERVACYVKADASGANDGTSWADAYTDLQSALDPLAGCGEARVAHGVYKPTATTDRAISFVIPPGIAIVGGYSGIALQRDPSVWRSVLSGDIDADDTGPNGIDVDSTQIKNNNSYHVVTMNGGSFLGPIGATTILDGITITGGKADATGDGLSGNGGGLLCAAAGATCSPMLVHLVFSGNLAANGGGALYDVAGGTASPVITQSTFTGNESLNSGGAIFNNGQGGSASPTIANVTFANNLSANCGSAIYDSNLAPGSTKPAIVNSTFVANSAGSGGSALCEKNLGGSAAATIVNVILWGNTAPDVSSFDGFPAPTLDHVIIPGGCPANATCTNLIGTDPLLGALQNSGGFTPAIMPGIGSSAIDAGFDPACAADPVGAVDQRGLPRPQGAHCDIGAVEATRLSLNVSDGGLFGFYGRPSLYVVTLQNLSATDAVSGVRIEGLGTAALNEAGTSWFCTIGSCTNTQTAGVLADTATLPPNSSLTWLVTAPVSGQATDTMASMTIRSSGAGAVVDTDTLAIFRATFD